MNWKRYGRKKSLLNLRRYPGTCLKVNDKESQSDIVGLQADIWTRDLPNTRQKC
jgi:hypothetical protein